MVKRLMPIKNQEISQFHVTARLPDLRDPAVLGYLSEALRPVLGEVSASELGYTPVRRVSQEVALLLSDVKSGGESAFDGLAHYSRIDNHETNYAFWGSASLVATELAPC